MSISLDFIEVVSIVPCEKAHIPTCHGKTVIAVLKYLLYVVVVPEGEIRHYLFSNLKKG